MAYEPLNTIPTLAGLRKILRVRLEQSGDTSYTDAELNTYINDAYESTVIYGLSKKMRKTVPIMYAQDEYDLEEMFEPIQVYIYLDSEEGEIG